MDPINKSNYLSKYDLTNIPDQNIIISVSNPT